MARKFLGGKPVVGTGSDEVVVETLTITATAPVTIDGTTSADLSANRTIAVSAASTSAAGVVQLSDSTSTTGSTKAATETAVKSAYDLAAAAVPKSTVTTAGDLIVATGNAAVTRLGIGASGTALTSNGTTAAWGTTVNGTTIPSSKTLVVTTDKLSALAATSSSELAGVISDETGSGALVFGTTPTIATPLLTLSTTTSTSDGRIAWDTTNDEIIVGTGAATVEFGPLGSTVGAALGAASAGTAKTSARADHVHPTATVAVTTLIKWGLT